MKKLIIPIFFLLQILLLAEDNSNMFFGLVVDSETNQPISGLAVKLKNNENKLLVRTDNYGQFSINLKLFNAESNPKLELSLMGYAVTYVNIKDNFPTRVVDDKTYSIIQVKPIVSKGEEVIVSAAKHIQAVQEVPISFSILKGSDINLRSTKSIEKILEFIPGVEIVRDNVSIRGTAGFTFGLGSRTALLLDGFPLLSGDNGDMKFEALPLYNIERVEIIKGAGSALYGTGALGGVINLITEQPKENKYSIRLFTGFFPKPSYDEWKYSDNLHFNSGVDLSIVQNLGAVSLIGTLGYYDKQSYRLGDEEKHITGFLKTSYKLNETDKINLLANVSLVNRQDWVYWAGIANPFKSQNDTLPRFNSNKYSLFADYQTILSEQTVLLIRAGSFYTTYDNNLKSQPNSYRQSNANAINTEAQLSTQLIPELNLTYGINAAFNLVRSFTFKDHNQSIYAAYVQGEFKGIKNLIMTLGIRTDREQTDNNDANIVLSPKFGLSYNPIDYLSLRGSLGRGFRAPTIAEKFTSVQLSGFNVLENTMLKPETSMSYEVGGTYRFKSDNLNLTFDLALFQNDLKNLIDPSFVGTTNVQFQNISIARIRGIEIGTKFLIAKTVGLETSVTLMEPVDSTLVTKLKYRAEQMLVSKLFVPLSKDLNIILNYRYKSKWKEIDLLLASNVKDATVFNGPSVLDLNINYNLQTLTDYKIELNLSCFNLLNYYYTEMVGNMGPTRMLNFQVRYTY